MGRLLLWPKTMARRVKVGDEANQWSRLENHGSQDHFLNPSGTMSASHLSSTAGPGSRQAEPDHHAVS